MRTDHFSCLRFVFALLVVSGPLVPARGEECKELKGHVGPVCSVVFSPDGKLLASGGDQDKDECIIIWDAASGKRLTSLKEKGGRVLVVGFSHDNETIINCCRKWEARLNHDTGALRWWSIAKKRLVVEKVFMDPVFSPALSPDGKLLSGGSGTIFNMDSKIWDAKTGEEIATLQGTEDYPCARAFSPDSKRLAIRSPRDHRLVIWDVAKKKVIGRAFPESGDSIAYSPDGAKIAVGGTEQALVLVNVAKPEEETTIRARHRGQREFADLAYLPDGRSLVAAYDEEIWIIDLATGRVSQKLDCHDEIIRLALSRDGKQVAVGCAHGTVKLWTLPLRK
jgi:WD40 repeat protein